MIEDRELLKLAAKAAGLRVKGYYEDEATLTVKLWPGHPSRKWNPLTDNADAFWLAVRLGMFYEGTPNGVRFQRYISQPSNTSPCGDIRRAVVLTAAEIGRNMT